MKKMTAMILTVALTCSVFTCTTCSSFAQETVSAEDCSIHEVEKTLDAVEGIEGVECEEESVTADEAEEQIFDTEYKQEEAEQVLTTSEDGVKYTVETYDTPEGKYVRAYSDDGTCMSNIEVSGDSASIDSYVYDPDEECYTNRNVDFQYTDNEEETDDFVAQGIKYGAKTDSACWRAKKYWYANGSNGKKTYLKIGQKATYRIRTDNLSDKKDKKCEAYKSAVKKSRSYMIKGAADIAGTRFTLSVITGLIVANAAFPPSVIVDIVLAAIGGGTVALAVSGVKNLVNSFEKWIDARDYYVTIRTYGTKL